MAVSVPALRLFFWGRLDRAWRDELRHALAFCLERGWSTVVGAGRCRRGERAEQPCKRLRSKAEFLSQCRRPSLEPLEQRDGLGLSVIAEEAMLVDPPSQEHGLRLDLGQAP